MVEDNKYLHIKFCQIQFSGCRGEVGNVTANQMLKRPSLMTERPEKHKLGGARILSTCFLFRLVQIRSVIVEKSKMFKLIRGQGCHICFIIDLKNLKDVY